VAPCGIGLGHVGRCVPIARKLEEKGAQILFSTYFEGLEYLEKTGFPFIEAPAVGVKVKPDGTIDFKQTAANPGPFLASFMIIDQIRAEIEAIQRFAPNVVVSDSRASTLIAAKILGIPTVCILNQFQVIIPRKQRFLRLSKLADAITLTLIGKIWTSSNHVLIPDFPQPYTISAGNLRIPKAYQKKVQLIGPIIPVQPQQLPKKEVLREKLGLDLMKPLIFAPISGPFKERAYLLEVLQRIFTRFPDEYQVVMSTGHPNAISSPTKIGNLTIYRWVPNRFEYLKACDLVVSRAGHGTLTHAICYGKPMILVPTPSHTEQANNALKAVKLGIAKIIEQKNLSYKSLLEHVEEMLNNGEPKRRANYIRKQVERYNGLKTTIEKISKLMETEN
jgi:uncharacterized protein (TIGR00661 family)